jgi:hypothetical protein
MEQPSNMADSESKKDENDTSDSISKGAVSADIGKLTADKSTNG